MVPNIKIKEFYDSTYVYGPKEFESINLKNKIIKKILIIKWGGMGDIILSTGAMQDIYEAFPNSKIHLNTLPQWKSLFKDDPRFDKIWGTKKSQKIGFLKHLYEWIKKIKYEKYDLIIDLQTNDRTRIYLTILKVIRQAPKFILGNHSVFPYSIFPKIVKNIERPLHLLQRTINTIGIESNNICPKLYITKEENKLALSILKNNKLAKEDYYDAIIIHPYAKIVKGKDVAGRMLTVIPEGTDNNDTYEIYKKRAIKYIISDFKLEIEKYNKTYNNKNIWLTEWNLQMSSITGNTLLQALFVAHQLIELASLQNSNIDIATFHNLAGRTISGSMIMRRNKKTNKNASFNSMRIVKELFRDSFFLVHKSEIKKDCFEYCFMLEDGNKKLYYWINWTEKPINSALILTGKKSEYFGVNLFDKNLVNQKFQYNLKSHINSEVILMPYSITLFEVTDN